MHNNDLAYNIGRPFFGSGCPCFSPVFLPSFLFDEAIYPAKELIPLYHEWWEHELVYDEQQAHQKLRRATKPANLRSEIPAGVVQEVYALLP